MKATGASFTNHTGIIDFNGHSYFFYHNGALKSGGSVPSNGDGYHRSVCLEEFTYNADGSFPTIASTTTGPKAIANLNPYLKNEAETIAWESGVTTEVCSEGGMDVTSIGSGDYIKVKNVDFGTGATSFTARVAASAAGGTIQIRLGSQTGTLVGTCNVSATGGTQTWADTTCTISGASGVNDLFFVFGGSSTFNFNNWQFTGSGPGTGGAGGASSFGGTTASGGTAAAGGTVTGGNEGHWRRVERRGFESDRRRRWRRGHIEHRRSRGHRRSQSCGWHFEHREHGRCEHRGRYRRWSLDRRRREWHRRSDFGHGWPRQQQRRSRRRRASWRQWRSSWRRGCNRWIGNWRSHGFAERHRAVECRGFVEFRELRLPRCGSVALEVFGAARCRRDSDAPKAQAATFEKVTSESPRILGLSRAAIGDVAHASLSTRQTSQTTPRPQLTGSSC